MVHPGHRAHGVLSGAQPLRPHLQRRTGGRRPAGRPPLRPLRVSASVVWPVTSPPVESGAVLTDSRGRITTVGPEEWVPHPPDVELVEYPDAVLLPGFVNVHTHLELHGFRGQLPETEFFTWIQLMRAIRESTPSEEYEESAPEGLREAWRCGITTVADTGTSGATVRALSELGGRGIYYQEAIGPDPRNCEEVFAQLTGAVRTLRDEASHDVAVGVSPHAPYTVSPQLLERVIAYARAEQLPLASHLAESVAETEFVSRGSGPFAESRHSRGIPMPPVARSPVEYAERAGLLGDDFLAIHMVRADSEDVAALARSGSAVAVCPRSNLRHGHGNAPLKSLLDAGLRVGLGTDSVASVESLDLLAEARAARGVAGLAAEDAIRLATIDGARALGMEAEIGSLEVGKWADFVTVRLNSTEGVVVTELASRLLAVDPEHIISTYVGGRRVHHQSDT